MKRRGFTLVETLIAISIGIVVSLAVFRTYELLLRLGASTSQSYLLSQEAGSAIAQIRHDLTETSLASIFLNKDGTEFSLASPRVKGEVQWSPEGVVSWETNVFYTLAKDQDNTGKLMRWESPRGADKHRVPLPFHQVHPATPKAAKMLVQNLLLPGKAVSLQNGEVSDDPGLDNAVLGFVRRDNQGRRTLSKINPTRQSDAQSPGWSAGSTGLVEVSLRVLEEGIKGKNSYLDVRFTVKPEN